jgi:hypothetical protein
MRTRIQNKSVDVRIYETLLELHNYNTRKVNRKFRFFKLKHELINI